MLKKLLALNLLMLGLALTVRAEMTVEQEWEAFNRGDLVELSAAAIAKQPEPSPSPEAVADPQAPSIAIDIDLGATPLF